MQNLNDKYFVNGIHIEEKVFNVEEVEQLRTAFYEVLDICESYRAQKGVVSGMDNTVHHVLFMRKIFQQMIQKDKNKKILDLFFDEKKYILNSLGGNNNTKANYASNIHRDVRFYTQDRLMLNSIWCISPLNKNTGSTQFLLNSHLNESPPTQKEFDDSCISIEADVGSIVYFDSRIWHRAGKPIEGLRERIIYTPIYSRPFIKPGFNYSLALQESEYFNDSSDLVKQLSSYFSDIPQSHLDWYGFNERRFYLKDQDQ
jgi:hypothetical protein